MNLYNNGTVQDWIDLYKGFNPSWNEKSPDGKVRSNDDLRNSYGKNNLNYFTLNSEYNHATNNSNSNSSYYFEEYHTKRRQTLFNLYAFTFVDSF